jgi:hypothetical protein
MKTINQQHLNLLRISQTNLIDRISRKNLINLISQTNQKSQKNQTNQKSPTNPINMTSRKSLTSPSRGGTIAKLQENVTVR